MFGPHFTGIGRYVYEFVKNAIAINAENGWPHEFVLFFNEPEYSGYETAKNVKKVLVNARHYSFKEQFKFPSKIKKEKVDVMFFPHFNVPIFYRKSYIVTIHDLTLSIFPGQKMTKFYHRIAYHSTIKNAVKRARKIIAVSENTKTDIVKFLHIQKEKIEVIYNGVGDEFRMIEDLKEFAPTLKKYNIKKEFLLYTGVWRSHKNLPRLIEAFDIIKNKDNLNLQLVITGKPDPHYPEVKEEIKKYKLKDDVICTEPVDEKDLIDLYNAADMYVFPSLYEGFGMPPLEAMKCGTPVVASNASSIPEICGKAAAYFDPYDAKDVAKKITEVYKNADKKAKLIEAGLIRAAKFSWKTAAEKIFDVLKSTI
jgi:glycosyltransferase involved in cell wall biosynthesis